jgi:hypothetical protein
MKKAVILTMANPSDPEQSALRNRIAAGANHRRYRSFYKTTCSGSARADCRS